MDKIDFKKELKALYDPKNSNWESIDVPEMNFLMVDGEGIQIPQPITSRP